MNVMVQAVIQDFHSLEALDTIVKKLDTDIQLRFSDKNKFDSCFNNLCNIFRNGINRVKSIYGPHIPVNGSTLFEDTVAIVSKLEDELGADIQSVSTPLGNKHIDEISDFYQDEIAINVLPFQIDEGYKLKDPISMAVEIDSLYHNICHTDIGMVFCTKNLNDVFFNRCIIEPLSKYIGEVQVEAFSGAQISSTFEPWYLHLLKENVNFVLIFNDDDILDSVYFHRIKEMVHFAKQRSAIIEKLRSPLL